MPQRWNARELNCYSHEEGRHLHIGNRLFYEDPDERVEPSARVVVASDAWARLGAPDAVRQYAHDILRHRW